MSQAYSDPKRANDPHALPNMEVFHLNAYYCEVREELVDCSEPVEACLDCIDADHEERTGWYWQACFPGCVPDGEPWGPFETEAEALADAQEGSDDDA